MQGPMRTHTQQAWLLLDTSAPAAAGLDPPWPGCFLAQPLPALAGLPAESSAGAQVWRFCNQKVVRHFVAASPARVAARGLPADGPHCLTSAIQAFS
jgi:hypothetical protein